MLHHFRTRARTAAISKNTRHRVLIVDDEPHVRTIVRRILAEEDLELLEASDGEDALAVVETHPTPVDLLLTDLNMPGMDGQQLADALRVRFPALKVLFLTGYSERLFVSGEILPSDCAFEDKPITAQGLRQAVWLLLRGKLTRPEPAAATPSWRARLVRRTEG